MLTRRAIVCAWLLALLAEPCLAKGVIRGGLFAPGAPEAGAPPGAQGAGRPHAQLADAVIYVEQVPAKVERKLAKKARRIKRTVWQERLQFAPRVLPAVVGDTVTFDNRDRVFHNAFSVSPARRFDLGKYPPGTKTKVAFLKPGVVNLHCDIHPKEAGFVVVVPNHVFTRPDSTGRYRLPRLPRGTYTVQAWHPRLGTLTREVEVPKKGNLTLDLRF